MSATIIPFPRVKQPQPGKISEAAMTKLISDTFDLLPAEWITPPAPAERRRRAQPKGDFVAELEELTALALAVRRRRAGARTRLCLISDEVGS